MYSKKINVASNRSHSNEGAKVITMTFASKRTALAA